MKKKNKLTTDKNNSVGIEITNTLVLEQLE